MTISVEDFGQTKSGENVSLFCLTNSHGNVIKLTNYGAILVSVEVPDTDGKRANVNLGYTSLSGYLERHPYFGSIVGRFCNRIANGRFEIDGQECEEEKNECGDRKCRRSSLAHLPDGKVC